MRTKTKCASFVTACCMAGLLTAQRPPASRQLEANPVKDVLPKVTVSEEILHLKQQLQRAMVFVDPATGEVRGPEQGELHALTGAGRMRTAAPAALAPVAPIQLPGGGVALPLDPANLDFLMVTKGPDGSISHAHVKAGETRKEASDAK